MNAADAIRLFHAGAGALKPGGRLTNDFRQGRRFRAADQSGNCLTDKWSASDRIQRHVALCNQCEVHPAEGQKNLGELPALQRPDRMPAVRPASAARNTPSRANENPCLKLGDVMQQIGIGNVREDVAMQIASRTD